MRLSSWVPWTAAAAGTAMLAAPAAAETFTVGETADSVDAAPGDGTCADAGGKCTPRAAIMEANALAGADTVTVPVGTFERRVFHDRRLRRRGDVLRQRPHRRGGGARVPHLHRVHRPRRPGGIPRKPGQPRSRPPGGQRRTDPHPRPPGGEPANDTALDAGRLPADQQGVLRPADGDGDGVSACDVGP